jgi:ribose transport system substrate-binding protein
VVLHRLKDQPWGLRMREELEAALRDRPELALEFADPEGDPARQAQMIEGFLGSGVAALVISPLERGPVQAVLRRHDRERIPVVLLDTDLDDPTLYRTLIVSDNRVFGRKMGEFFLEAAGGAADLLELRGAPGADASVERAEGLRQAIAGTRVRIVESVTANWMCADARAAVTKLLPRFPRLDGIVAQNDEMARGAWEAADAAGRAQELLITGVGGLKGPYGLQLVMQGKLAATLLKPVPGEAVADALLAILAGEPVLPKQVLQTSVFRSHEAIRAWREARKALRSP